MANIAGSYDQNAEASGDFSPIPTGNYRAKIIESAIEPISKNSDKGKCLRLTWQIETGPYDNRLVWQRLNMWPENMQNMEKVVSIANSQFASIRQATGKIAPQDSAELERIPCEIYVGLSKPQQGYNQQKEVKSVKAVGGGGQSAPASVPRQAASAQQQRQAPPSANNGGDRPWKRAPAPAA